MSIANADDLDWRADAACLQYDPAVFFPDQGGLGHEAKRICATCPTITRLTCLEENLFEPEGVFGGKTPNQRLKIRRARGVTTYTKRPAA